MFWEKKTKIRKHIIFYGRVQGVGFRYYAVQKANQLGLTGWVKNLYDGSVEMEVEGEEPLIDQLIIFSNVPFGNHNVFDKRYNKENFKIHDYFFAKSYLRLD